MFISLSVGRLHTMRFLMPMASCGLRQCRPSSPISMVCRSEMATISELILQKEGAAADAKCSQHHFCYSHFFTLGLKNACPACATSLHESFAYLTSMNSTCSHFLDRIVPFCLNKFAYFLSELQEL